MKSVFSAILAGSILAVGVVGCSQSPRSANRSAQPSITAVASRSSQQVGETTRITANTRNLIGASNVTWSVSPNTARITPDGQAGQQALFSADQPGTYIVTARADAGDRTIQSETTITVHGRPITTDRDGVERRDTTDPNRRDNR